MSLQLRAKFLQLSLHISSSSYLPFSLEQSRQLAVSHSIKTPLTRSPTSLLTHPALVSCLPLTWSLMALDAPDHSPPPETPSPCGLHPQAPGFLLYHFLLFFSLLKTPLTFPLTDSQCRGLPQLTEQPSFLSTPSPLVTSCMVTNVCQ